MLIAVLLLSTALCLHGATLRIGAGQTYANLQPAAQAAAPGDTILVFDGLYAGGQYVANLRGRADAWITIMAAPGASPVWQGGVQAWHLVEAAFVRVVGITFEGQSGNGVNVDDGGTYDTPAQHVIFERCSFRRMNASGNNDLLKLSGLDYFEIRDCVFEDGAAGGSAADMVGCHHGLFFRNSFTRMGANAIQAKGGTSHITIERNYFEDCGARTLNLGGSTGLQFFRPDTAQYEAADLYVYANVFVGSEAPIAYVGCTNVHVVNNTIYKPTRWVIRILQETVDTTRFVKCGNSVFRNNIVYRGALSTDCNVGPDTDPQSFVFSNNLWFNYQTPGSSAPRGLPVSDVNSVTGLDPLFADTAGRDFSISASSPAAGAGYSVSQPALDYEGYGFAATRSIGAHEANPAAVGRSGAPRPNAYQAPGRSGLLVGLHGRVYRSDLRAPRAIHLSLLRGPQSIRCGISRFGEEQ